MSLGGPTTTISLKVLESYTRDVGRGIARIDYDTMESVNAKTGDIIEIKGKRRTVAKILPLYPSDEQKSIIRIDVHHAPGRKVHHCNRMHSIVLNAAMHCRYILASCSGRL